MVASNRSLFDLVIERIFCALSTASRGLSGCYRQSGAWREQHGMGSMYRPIFFAPPDMAEHRYEFEQQLQTAGPIDDGSALDCLGRGGGILNDPISLGYAEPKWHQSGYSSRISKRMVFLLVAERCVQFLEGQSSDTPSGNCQSGRQALVIGASILLS